MFPQLAGARIAFRWCGRVAVTPDHLPHLHEPAPGLLIDIGCQGRGIGLQSAMGKAMAEYIATSDATALPLPFTPIAPIPFHGLQRAYVGAVVTWYRLTDGRWNGTARPATLPFSARASGRLRARRTSPRA
jgi:hypothetical protein